VETHIHVMLSHRTTSPDLFAYAEKEPVRREPRAAAGVRLPRPEQLAALSEGELAELVALLGDELQRRLRPSVNNVGPDLKGAVERFASVLPAAPATKSRVPDASPVLEGKRKAIKAALKAGVKPTQVARHFGLSPAEVRKVASQAD
jgi:hypothetical protein